MTSTPIPGFGSADAIETPDYWNLQIDGTASQIEAIALAIEGATEKGLIDHGLPELQCDPATGQRFWRIKFNYTNVGDRFALPGDYIVLGTSRAGDLISIELCKGPDSTNVENRAFADHFTIVGGGS